MIDFFIDIAKNIFLLPLRMMLRLTPSKWMRLLGKNEKILEAEKKKAKQTKAKLNSDLKANEVKILEIAE